MFALSTILTAVLGVCVKKDETVAVTCSKVFWLPTISYLSMALEQSLIHSTVDNMY